MQDERKKPPDIIGQMLTGMIEVMFGFGVVLANRGLVERAELAREFRFLVEQQRLNTKTIAGQAELEARSAAALTLAELFARPVHHGPVVIQGGKGSPASDVGGDGAA